MSNNIIPWPKIIFWLCFAGFVSLVICVGVLINENRKLENTRLIQNHGTTNVVFPVYYIDPRTEKCFAAFPNQAKASVECDEKIKNIISNYWINNKE